MSLTQSCPVCGASVTMTPYDIGSGPEMSCSACQWCWGANGQPLKPMRLPQDVRDYLTRLGWTIAYAED